jgi:hypothetical protein
MVWATFESRRRLVLDKPCSSIDPRERLSFQSASDLGPVGLTVSVRRPVFVWPNAVQNRRNDALPGAQHNTSQAVLLQPSCLAN